MGWIDIKDKYPPQGLNVLLEVSGMFAAPYRMIADHGFFIGSWIVPESKTEGEWVIYDSCGEDDYHFVDPEVHAWMPLPRHFAKNDIFDSEDDMMEHAMFERDPEYLYQGDCVYEQLSIEDFMKEQSDGM